MLREYLLVLVVAPSVALAIGAAVIAGLAVLAGTSAYFAFAPPLVTLALTSLAGGFAEWRCEETAYELDPFLTVGTLSTVFGALAVLLALNHPVLSSEEHLLLLVVSVVGPFLGSRYRRRQSDA